LGCRFGWIHIPRFSLSHRGSASMYTKLRGCGIGSWEGESQPRAGSSNRAK
jgi:hypothetical protein